MKRKSILFLLAAFLLLTVFAVTACKDNNDSSDKKVAIAMANSSASWQRNGQDIKQELEKQGFTTDLQFADTAEQQANQLRAMLEENPKCIIIGAVNSEALTDALKAAKEKKIPVISYDRLVMNSDSVSYYASFDGEAVGTAMGKYLEAALNLKSGAGPYNIEIFAGDPADNNAHVFYHGAMKILQPYFDKGQLVCRSKETTFDATATKDWKPENAQARMEKLLAKYYADGTTLNAVLSPNDGLAGGIIQALEAGYHGSWPLITGQDADKGGLEAIRQGKQAITIFKDPNILNAKCVKMVKAVVEGTQPDINDNKNYNNGAITVPVYLCTPLIIDKDNLDEVK